MCKQCDNLIPYAEAMRLIDDRFGTVNAAVAKRNLERMMEWYQREGPPQERSNRRNTPPRWHIGHGDHRHRDRRGT